MIVNPTDVAGKMPSNAVPDLWKTQTDGQPTPQPKQPKERDILDEQAHQDALDYCEKRNRRVK